MNEFESLPLRDIHLPEPVSWWPPALGWWFVLAGVLLLAIVVWYWRKQRQDTAMQKTALGILQETRMSFYVHGNEYRLLEELSALLRRTSVSIFPRQEVAALSGKAWLEFLDKCMQQNGTETRAEFSLGVGRVFADTLYKQPERTALSDADAVCRLVEQWIRCLPKQKSNQLLRWRQ